jgi:hypothetical protein
MTQYILIIISASLVDEDTAYARKKCGTALAYKQVAVGYGSMVTLQQPATLSRAARVLNKFCPDWWTSLTVRIVCVIQKSIYPREANNLYPQIRMCFVA